MTDKTKGDHIDKKWKCNEYYKKTAIICGVHSLQEVLPLISRRTRNFMILEQKEHDLEQIFIYNCRTP